MSEQSPPAPEHDDDLDRTDDVQALRREAASRRRALRDSEAQNAQLRERVDTQERKEVERLAGERMASPSDLLLAVSLDDLRGDDGLLDSDRAAAAITDVLNQRPHWAKATPEPEPEGPAPHPDHHHGPRGTAQEPKPLSFGKELKGARFG
jgi:hypothetical protein